MWWTCDHDVAATKVTCDMEVSGDVNDNTDGPVEGIVWGAKPDKFGNVIAFATAEVVTAGRFGELECNGGFVQEGESPISCDSNGSGGKGTRVWSVGSETARETTSGTRTTVGQGSGSGAAATAASTASGTAATASAGAAGGFGVDAVRLAALLGGAAVAAW